MARIEKNDGSYIIQSYFRHGKIIEIDDGDSTAKVQLQPEKEGEEGLILENVPIFFHCDDNAQPLPNGALAGAAAAFKSNDNVAVVFSGDEQTAKIVANLTKKRPCSRIFCLVIDDYVYRFSYEVNEQTRKIVIKLKETVPFTPLAEGYIEPHPLFDILGIDERYVDHIQLRAFQYPFLFKGGQLLVYITKYIDPFYGNTYLKIYFIDQSGQGGTLIWQDTLAWGKDYYDYAIGGEDGNIIYFAKYRNGTHRVECDILKYNQTNLTWEHTRKYVPIVDTSEIFIGVNPDGTVVLGKSHNNHVNYIGEYSVYDIYSGAILDNGSFEGDQIGVWYKTPFDWIEDPSDDETKKLRGYIRIETTTIEDNTNGGGGQIDSCIEGNTCGEHVNCSRHHFSNYQGLYRIAITGDFLNIYVYNEDLDISLIYSNWHRVEDSTFFGDYCYSVLCTCHCLTCTGTSDYYNEKKNTSFLSKRFGEGDTLITLQSLLLSLPAVTMREWRETVTEQEDQGPERRHYYDFNECVPNYYLKVTDGNAIARLLLNGKIVWDIVRGESHSEFELVNTCTGDVNTFCYECYLIDWYELDCDEMLEEGLFEGCCIPHSEETSTPTNKHVPSALWTGARKDTDNILTINEDGTIELWINDRTYELTENVTEQIIEQLGLVNIGIISFTRNAFTFWE